MKNNIKFIIIRILIMICIAQNSCFAQAVYLATPGANQCYGLFAFNRSYFGWAAARYESRKDRVEVVKKILRKNKLFNTLNANQKKEIIYFSAYFYFPPLINEQEFAEIISFIVMDNISMQKFQDQIKIQTKTYLNKKIESLSDTIANELFIKAVEEYKGLIPRIYGKKERKKQVKHLMEKNNIGLSIDFKTRELMVHEFAQYYFTPFITTAQYDALLKQYADLNSPVIKYQQFMCEKMMDIFEMDIHKDELFERMRKSLLFQEMTFAFFSMISAQFRSQIPRIIDLLHYFESAALDTEEKQQYTKQKQEFEERRFKTYAMTAHNARGFIKRNKQKYLDEGLHITTWLGHSYEVFERLKKMNIKADMFGYIDKDKGIYHVWVVTKDGFIIDPYPVEGEGYKILRVSDDAEGIYAGKKLTNNNWVNLISDMKKWNTVSKILLKHEKKVLGGNPEKAIKNYAIIKKDPRLSNVAQAIDHFLSRNVEGVGNVLYKTVDKDGNYNEEFLGEFVGAFEVEQHVKYGRIIQLSKTKFGHIIFEVPELDYVLEVDPKKYYDKITDPENAVELFPGIYLGESKTLNQLQHLKTAVKNTISEKRGKYIQALSMMRGIEKKNVKGIIITMGGAGVRAGGKYKFSFEEKADVDTRLFIAYVPDTVLHPYQPGSAAFVPNFIPKQYDLRDVRYIQRLIDEHKNELGDDYILAQQVLLNLLIQTGSKTRVVDRLSDAMTAAGGTIYDGRTWTKDRWKQVIKKLSGQISPLKSVPAIEQKALARSL